METTPLLARKTNTIGPQIWSSITSGLLAVCCGLHMGWPSPSILKMQADDLSFPITGDEISYVVMIAPLGYLIGSPLAGVLLDKLGRKPTLLLLALPQLLGWILIATSTCVETLYVARVITGVADGALFTSLPIYVGEIAEPRIRGLLATFHSVGILLGVLLINAYGSYLSIIMTAWVSACFPLLFLITFIWMPESPYFLIFKNKVQAATASLQALRRRPDVNVELFSIIEDTNRQTSEQGRYRDIFCVPTNFKAFLILIGLRTVQQFSGLSAIGFYTQVIIVQGGGSLSPADSAILCSGVQVIFSCFSSVLLERFGRRPLLLTSCAVSSVTLIVLGIYFSFQIYNFDMSGIQWLPVAALMVYYIASAGGLIMVPNVMAGELLSVNIKSKACGIVNMYLGLLVSGSSKLFQTLDYSWGSHMPFYVFGICCIVGLVFCYIYVPETKGKTLEQIQKHLKGDMGTETKKNGSGSCTKV